MRTLPRTLLVQTAKINIYGVPLLGGMLESLLISSYSGTIGKVYIYICTCMTLASVNVIVLYNQESIKVQTKKSKYFMGSWYNSIFFVCI